MYLSRVRVLTEGLDRNALIRLMSGDAYANHQLLWKLFTDQPERRFLFRQEIEQEQLSAGERPRALPLFYTLSSEEPQEVPGLLQYESRPFQPQLKTGDHLAFRLRANPTVARRNDTKKNSVRHDVLMDAKKQCQRDHIESPNEVASRMDQAALEWLKNKEESSGFEMPVAPQVSGYRQHIVGRKGREIRFSSVDYEGVLRVMDPDRFLSSLFFGLGRSKAFGCGLMLIRRT